ncbi:MAG TPA: SH3 domain-containing protein, partial [Thermomicrobiales bacterium]|nr:SH3 domain-containing protein [Thermomicrobiales bacterium]
MQRRRGFGAGRLALTLAVAGIGWAATVAPPPDVARAAILTTATIANAQDGVNLRAQPSYDAQVLGVVPDGADVDLRTASADTVNDPDGATRWWPVETDIGTGWVAGFFLQFPAGTAGAPPSTGQNDGVGGPSDGGPVLQGGSAAIVDEPAGVNFRAQPGSAGQLIQPLKFDTVVGLRIDVADTIWIDGARWWPVAVNGLDGWVAGDYLAPFADNDNAGGQTDGQAAPPAAAGSQSSAQDAPGKNATAAGYFTPGSYAAARTDDGSGVNVRADAAPDAEKVGGVPESDVIQVMDGPVTDPTGANWYQVTDGNLAGWVDAAFLQPANQPANGALGRILSPGALAGAVGVATGALGFPLQSYTLTQGFGCTPLWLEPWNAALGCNFHNGVDLAAPYGSPIEAADGGTVEQAGWCDCGLGYYVKID